MLVTRGKFREMNMKPTRKYVFLEWPLVSLFSQASGTKKIYAPIELGAFLTNFTLDFLTLINIVINTLWFQTLV